MTIRITLQKDAYVGWNGRETPAREQVREFADHYEAADWLVHDSYFAEGYTRRLVWEVIDNVPATVPPPSGATGATTPINGIQGVTPNGDVVRRLGDAWVAPEAWDEAMETKAANGAPTYATGGYVGAGGSIRDTLQAASDRAHALPAYARPTVKRPVSNGAPRTSGPLDPEIHAALVRSVERGRREAASGSRETGGDVHAQVREDAKSAFLGEET